MLVVIATLTVLLLGNGPPTARAGGSYPGCRPKILVLRGVFEVFSLGMNDLAHKLRCRGYDAKVTSWILALNEVECSDPRPLVVVGHSLGGRMCAWASRKLKSCGRRVPLIIVVDANLLQRIPPNVDNCLNLYVTNKIGIFHGSPVRPESRCTHIVNWDVSQGQPPWYAGGVNHFDIDSTDWVHQIIIDEIDAMFGPPMRPQPAMAPLGPAELHGATAMGGDRGLGPPVSPPGRQGLAAPSSDTSPSVGLAWRPPFAAARQAGEPVPRQPARERDPAGHATQTGSADFTSQPAPGLRLRFATPIDPSAIRLADRNLPTDVTISPSTGLRLRFASPIDPSAMRMADRSLPPN